MIANGDVDKATSLYDYMIKGMEDLPVFDPVSPSVMQQVKDGAVQTFAWLNNNQETVWNWVGFIRSLMGKGAAAPSAPAEPIPPIK